MKMTATPSARRRRITSNRTETSRSSSDEVGSSMITSRALNETARAMATICWFAAEEDVLGHRSERNEVDFLVDGADAPMLGVLRGREVDGFAAEDDRARVAA